MTPHGPARPPYDGDDPTGDDIVVTGGMVTHQVVVCGERVYVVQITYSGF
ncbi:hypothetical protein ACIRPR_16700 [Streptomyces griseoflavus]